MFQAIYRSISNFCIRTTQVTYHALTNFFWQKVSPQDASQSRSLQGRVSSEQSAVVELKTRRELHAYLAKFSCGDKSVYSQFPLMRSLHVSNINLTREDFEMIKPHFKNLHHLSIGTQSFDVRRCKNLKTLDAPQATEVYATDCANLKILDALRATHIDTYGCKNLTSLNTPKATIINVWGCISLITLNAPMATEIDANACRSLTTLNAPMATEIDADGCTSLTTLNAPLATKISAKRCKSLTSLNVPKATSINVHSCTRLISLDAPLATHIDARDCLRLTSLIAPMATWIYAQDCRSLTSFNTPMATWIHAQDCPNLTSLTKDQLPLVETLTLGGNSVRALPMGIESLDTLKTLNLSYSANITGLPSGILSLPITCTVDLSRCPNLSSAVRERLREETSQDGYQGPRFSYSMPSEAPGQQQPLEKILEDLWKWSGKSPEEFRNLPGDDMRPITYVTWLNHLSEMADYKASGERKKQLATTVLDILKLANEDPAYRTVFSAVLEEASTTCGDRMALSLLHLDIQQQLATFDVSDTRGLVNFLVHGVWTLALLEGVAREKIPTLKFVDEIEVYLGYPVMLKDRLQIPISVESMLFFTCSAIKQPDLNLAERHVRAITSSEKERLDFLLGQSKWVEALEHKYPNELNSLKEVRTQALENDDHEALESVDKAYKDKLRSLTQETLG